MNVTSVILFTCLFLWLLLAIYIIWSWLNTPWYPTKLRELDEFLDGTSQLIPRKGKFIDLGSGDGRVVNWAASKGYEAHGIELNPYLTLVHRLKRLFHKSRKNVYIHNKNFLGHNFIDYDVVYMYIFPEQMVKIREKLWRELKPGSVIISNVFEFPDLKPDIVSGKFKIYRLGQFT